MKSNIKFILTVAMVIIMAKTGFTQQANLTFNQKAPPSGNFIGRSMRSCFGGDVSNAKVIAIVTRADWCMVCQKNEERVAAILPDYKSKPISFIANDITDARSQATSAKYLKKLHLTEVTDPVKESGVILLIDAHSHQVINKVSLSGSNQEIKHAIDNALKINM